MWVQLKVYWKCVSRSSLHERFHLYARPPSNSLATGYVLWNWINKQWRKRQFDEVFFYGVGRCCWMSWRYQREGTENQGNVTVEVCPRGTGQPHFFCSQSAPRLPTPRTTDSTAQPFERPCTCYPDRSPSPHSAQTSPLLRTWPTSSAQRGHELCQLPPRPNGELAHKHACRTCRCRSRASRHCGRFWTKIQCCSAASYSMIHYAASEPKWVLLPNM